MNKQEKSMMAAIKAASPRLKDLKETTEGTYSPYDCYADDVVVELKHRRGSHYENTLIEQKKMKSLQETMKTALYAVYSSGNIYLFNLTRLYNEGYDFSWGTQGCPAHTVSSFGSTAKVSKKVGYIAWNKADRVIPIVIK